MYYSLVHSAMLHGSKKGSRFLVQIDGDDWMKLGQAWTLSDSEPFETASKRHRENQLGRSSKMGKH